jgi:hypothetical protein
VPKADGIKFRSSKTRLVSRRFTAEPASSSKLLVEK